jgi:hypothetical protein
LSFHEFLGLLFDMKQSGSLVKWETFSVASQGTVVILETGDGLQAYVITDVNFSGSNSADAVVAAATTTSGFFVSTGSGVTMTVKNNGLLTAWAVVMAWVTAGQTLTRLNFTFYLSTVSIPAAGSAPNLGDLAMGNGAWEDPAYTTLEYPIPVLGFKDSGLAKGTTVYVYLAFNSGNALANNNIDQGRIHVTET